MEKKSNKEFIITIVILSISLLSSLGYICYDKFIDVDNKDKVQTQNKDENSNENFYSIENLIKNKYIKEITSNSTFEEQYIKIENGKVYILDYEKFNKEPSKNIDEIGMIEAKGIEGTPKKVFSDFVQSHFNYMFLVLTEEGDLYYLSVKSDNLEFKKINTVKVIRIFGFDTENIGIINYPYDEMTFYAELEDGKLMEISMDSQLTKTFEEKWPYPDKICSHNMTADGFCEGLVISPDRILFNEKYDNESKSYVYNEIKFQDSEIKVKEALSSITDDDARHYFIISMDNQIYEVIQNIDDYSITSVKLYKDVKVKEITYSNPDDHYTTGDEFVTINYADGTNEKFDKTIVSSLYYRYNK